MSILDHQLQKVYQANIRCLLQEKLYVPAPPTLPSRLLLWHPPPTAMRPPLTLSTLSVEKP